MSVEAPHLTLTAHNRERVVYGTKAFKNKNPNSNPSFKNMTKIVRFLNRWQRLAFRTTAINQFSIAGIQNDGF